MGRLYVYKLTCQLFRYAQEDFETGVPEIDEIEPIRAYGQQLIMEPVGGSGKYEIGENVFQGTTFATADAVAVVVASIPTSLSWC